MKKEQAKTVAITLYPSQIKKVLRLMEVMRLRRFSQAMQRLVDDAMEPVRLGVGSSAEKQDTGGGFLMSAPRTISHGSSAEKQDTGETCTPAGNIGA